MAVQIAPGKQFGSFSASSTPNIANGVNNALVASGWTSTKIFGVATFTFPGLPTNGQTFTVGSTTYTFQTSLNNAVANNILIAATAAIQAQYLADAVNAVTGGGTEWSTPTVANTICSATNTGAEIICTGLAGGMDANSLFSLSGLSGFFAVTLWSNKRGFMLTNTITPQGMQGSLWIEDLRGQFQDRVAFWWGTPDGTLQSLSVSIDGSSTVTVTGTLTSLVVAGGRTLTIDSNAYQFFVWLAGDNATRGCQVGLTSPYLRAGQTPLAVSAVTNNGGLIEVATSAPNTLVTGNSVSIFGATGTVPVNGPGTVTVIDSTHFTINGSTFSGSYAGGGLVGGPGGSGQIGGLSRCLLGWGDNDGTSYQNTWRNTLGVSLGFVITNENSYGFDGGGRVAEMIFSRRRTGGLFYAWGGLSDSQEARIGWPGTALAAQFIEMGQFWDCLVVNDSLPMDRTNTGYLSHNWVNQTNFDGEGALWITTN